jgi:hypothetical protein
MATLNPLQLQGTTTTTVIITGAIQLPPAAAAPAALIEGAVTNASKICFCIPPIVEGTIRVGSGLVAFDETVCCGTCGTRSEVVPLRNVSSWETVAVEPKCSCCDTSAGVLLLHSKGRTLDPRSFIGRDAASSLSTLLWANARADAPTPPHLAYDASRSVFEGSDGCCGSCCDSTQQRIEVGPQDALQLTLTQNRPCRDKTSIATSTKLAHVDFVKAEEPIGCCACSEGSCGGFRDTVTIGAGGSMQRRLQLPTGSAVNVQRAITDRARHPASGTAEVLIREFNSPTLCCGSMGSMLITNDAVILRKAIVGRGCWPLSCCQSEETTRVPLSKVNTVAADDCDGWCFGLCSKSSSATCCGLLSPNRGSGEFALLKASSGGLNVVFYPCLVILYAVSACFRSLFVCARDACIRPLLSCLSCSTGRLVVIDLGEAGSHSMRLNIAGTAPAFTAQTVALIRNTQDQNRNAAADYDNQRGAATPAAPKPAAPMAVTVVSRASEGLPASPGYFLPIPPPPATAPDLNSAREMRVQSLLAAPAPQVQTWGNV